MIYVAWSGGIDSTAVLAHLLRRGHSITAVSIDIYREQAPQMAARESQAREDLKPLLTAMPGSIRFTNDDGRWLQAFRTNDGEIPHRNRHVIDFLICSKLNAKGGEIGLGEYIGADTWIVQDHVEGADADVRSLTAYIYSQWGLSYRLWSLADFGSCRYKHERLHQLIEASSIDVAYISTNCLRDSPIHCGECYKCMERRAAFVMLGWGDETEYLTDPSKQRYFDLYLQQMRGKRYRGPSIDSGDIR